MTFSRDPDFVALTDSNCHNEPGHDLPSVFSQQMGQNAVQDELIIHRTVAALVEATVLTGMALISFVYQAVKKIRF